MHVAVDAEDIADRDFLGRFHVPVQDTVCHVPPRPALIRRFHEAKATNAPTVTIWGSGTPRREFLYVDDMAAASVFVMNLSKTTLDAQPMQSHINVGFGEDVTIKELALVVGKTVGYQGVIEFDISKPDGAPRKLMDSSRLNALGWQAQVGLKAGLVNAYQDYLSQPTT
jgi:GDP-L-fucose synthase